MMYPPSISVELAEARLQHLRAAQRRRQLASVQLNEAEVTEEAARLRILQLQQQQQFQGYAPPFG